MTTAATYRHSHRWLLPALLVLTLILFLLSLMFGQVPLSVTTIGQALLDNAATLERLIVLDIRLPRALLAASVGAALGLAGAALQGLFRNPLAEAGLVGVSSCASLGAIVALYYGFTHWSSTSWVNGLLLPAFGMAGALLSVLAMFALAGRSSLTGLLLAGVAINAFAGSCIALALNFAPNPYAMSEMVYWLLGSFANRTMLEFWFALPFLLVGMGLMLNQRRFLDALSFGEETAQSLGFAVPRARGLLILGVAAAVGAAVSVSGSIGFVGLVIPHLLRPLVAHQPGRLLLVSMIAGAAFMLLADILVRVISPQQELKIGVVTALVGAPFFLYLVAQWRSRAP